MPEARIAPGHLQYPDPRAIRLRPGAALGVSGLETGSKPRGDSVGVGALTERRPGGGEVDDRTGIALGPDHDMEHRLGLR